MAGSRGGVGRIAAMVVALVGLLGLLLAESAWAGGGGSYRVVQCGWGVGAELDLTFPTTEGTAFSLNPAACTPPPGVVGPPGMKFEGGVAPDGAVGLARARWVAPPGTSFTAAALTWSGSPQPGNWQGLAVDVGSTFHLLTSGVTDVAATPVALQTGDGAWAFEAFLECLLGGPTIGCTRSVPSTMRLSGVTFTLADSAVPQATLGGALVAPGWHRGAAPLELTGGDVGAGLAAAAATIDGTSVLSVGPACSVQAIEGETRGTKMQPCPPTATRSVEVDTSRLADGDHTVRACATDFAGNQGCAPDARIEVDNSPPAISFVSADEGEVAATVSDRYAGPASGTISLRRAEAEAWTDLPSRLDRKGDGQSTLTAPLPELKAGTYLFRAVAADAAGNTGSAELRVSGSPAEIRRGVADPHGAGKGPAPRARATHLVVHLAPSGRRERAARPVPADRDSRESEATFTTLGLTVDPANSAEGRGRRTGAHGTTVDYGTAVDVLGRLTDAHGAPVAGRPVVVVTRTVAGIGARPERRRAVTDRHGRFDSRLASGASRHVTVDFHGGGGLGPAPRRSLTLRVRAGLTLDTEPTELDTGESVRFHGRVRLGPAHLTSRGKLVAIQYLERATRRWRPALVVRTDAKGRFDTSYRFRYVTGLALIRLRATAPAEGGWPFARGSSSPVTVTVRGR
jgi:hypothetical protein